MTREEAQLIPMPDLRTEVLALVDERDAALERAALAERQEMVGVTREMAAVAFVSRDLVQRAFDALTSTELRVPRDELRARAALLLSEALGR